MRLQLEERRKPDRFDRYQNIMRFKRFLERARDDNQRAHLAKLIDEEKQKQKDAGDPRHPY